MSFPSGITAIQFFSHVIKESLQDLQREWMIEISNLLSLMNKDHQIQFHSPNLSKLYACEYFFR